VPGTSQPRTTNDSTSSNVPGRTSPDRSRLATRDDHTPVWAKYPKYIGNHPEPLYPIGALAAALERDSSTMRAWITNGWLPEARYRKKTPDVRGHHHFYIRRQIEALVEIAAEEGLLGTNRGNPASTHFPQRAREMFDQLAAQAHARRTAFACSARRGRPGVQPAPEVLRALRPLTCARVQAVGRHDPSVGSWDPRVPRHRPVERADRGHQPVDQEDQARRSRLPQVHQLPTPPPAALWRRPIATQHIARVRWRQPRFAA
jgi:hypothetical protein